MTSKCSGPCLPWCFRKVGVVHEHISLVAVTYVLSCVLYLVFTRNTGTLLADSLTAKQRKLKQQSAKVRGRIFSRAVLCAAAVVFVTKALLSK